MTHYRCFRLDELDVEELRDHTRDQRQIDALSHWVKHFASRVDDVILEISEAFADTQLNGGIGLFQTTGLDNYASDEELKQLRDRDEKTDWRRIPDADLERCHAAPAFFDARGFVFHLPAYLIAELNDRQCYGFIDRLYLTEEHPEGWRQLLTGKQRNALISILNLIREHPSYEHHRSEIDSAVQRLGNLPHMGQPYG